MKKLNLLNSFPLVPGRDIVKNFLAFFRFTEADACTLLSAYGLDILDVDRLQNNRSDEKKETGGSSRKVSHGKQLGEPPWPIPIGVHPDFSPANWTTASRKDIRTKKPQRKNFSPKERTGAEIPQKRAAEIIDGVAFVIAALFILMAIAFTTSVLVYS
jgi:hypothetical protein